MIVTRILEKMIAASGGNVHDIDHLLRVWSYAKLIGEAEGLDDQTQTLLEIAAITHDIACPYCREVYGAATGKDQEREGARLAAEFLQGFGLTAAQIDRVCFLIAHHHSPADISTLDLQILIEADYLANATENSYSEANVCGFLSKICKTAAGQRLIRSILLKA